MILIRLEHDIANVKIQRSRIPNSVRIYESLLSRSAHVPQASELYPVLPRLQLAQVSLLPRFSLVSGPVTAANRRLSTPAVLTLQ